MTKETKKTKVNQKHKYTKKDTKNDLTGHSGGEVAGGTVSTALTG